MGFHDERLPDELDYGYEGGPGFQTIVQTTASGHEERITRWGEARHRYRCNKSLLTPTEAEALKDFFLARRGALYAFPFKDWNDFTSAADGISATTNTDVTISSGDGTTKKFQLFKSYFVTGSGINPYVRTIRLVVTSSVKVALDGVNQTSGWTVNRNGVLTFTTAPTNGQVITAGFEFDVPVRFGETLDQWMATQQNAYQRSNVLDIELVEVLDEVEMPDTWDAGGSYSVTTAFDITLAVASGRLVQVNNTAGTTINVYLPAPTYLSGGTYWTIQNAAASTSSIQIRDDAGSTVGSAFAAGATKTIGLLETSGSKAWLLW